MLYRSALLLVCVCTLALGTPMLHSAAPTQLCADSWECHLGGQELASVTSDTLVPVLTAAATKSTLLERLEDLLLACFDSRGCLAQPDLLALYLTETP